MRSIVLAIKPEYLSKIIQREKLYEFRRRIPKDNVSRIYFYCTAPHQHVLAQADVTEILSGTPSEIWEQTRGYAGISLEKYNEYFDGRDVAYAYKLDNVSRYSQSKTLQDFALKSAPQSFAYVDM